ncbi:phosphotransferase [Tolypothrix sp. VBCCA 56010]|uniref:phosphotransferase n=1 Tax=Tolypothrix sp. VBCCA 56010 TaxID=3137731 RepID=UPI003D7D1CA9
MGNSQHSQLSKEDAIALLNAWSFLEILKVQPTNQGTVNTTFFVETQTEKYVLKLYNDSITTAQIEYEHSLLAYLRSRNLSFVVPTPIPTSFGETLVTVKQDNSLLRVALLPFIAGNSSDRQNLAHTHAISQTLGELHHALAKFDFEGKMAQLPAWGDLNHIHPLVTPLEIPKLLKLTLMQQQRLVKTLTEVIEAAPNLYKILPVQTTHADYLSPNVLLLENRVVGVLDFEFATFDLRLMDYVAALDHFTRFSGEAPSLEFVKAFSTGYAKHVCLSQLELEALTLVWRLQQASCIVYWTGWLIEGKVTHQSVVDAVARMLLLSDWLEENTATLLSTAFH